MCNVFIFFLFIIKNSRKKSSCRIPDNTVSGTTPENTEANIANINQVNGVNEPMIQWWINFRKSRLELHGEDGDEHGLMWKIFE